RSGAIPVALTRGSSKKQALLKAGAGHSIATEDQDLVKELLGVAGGNGGGRRVDPRGGPTGDKLRRATGRSRVVFLDGARRPEPTPLPLFDVLSKWVTIRGYVLLEITADRERLQKGKEFVSSGLADGSFKPLVARTFPLEQIVEAHRFLESNQQIGKVVVTV